MKKLWVLPLAALVCGRPVNPPRLKSAIPAFRADSCEESVRKEFLFAYAYQKEEASKFLSHLRRAEELLRGCGDKNLRLRISALKNSSL